METTCTIRTLRHCEHCGRDFRKMPYEPDRYCSQRCAYKAMTRPVEERFWPKVDLNGPVPAHRPELGPCWVWTAARGPRGYGQLSIGPPTNRPVVAHRISWQIHNGPIPEGMDICHHCDFPPCVRPDHLFAGTPFDNMRDCAAKGRGAKPSELRRERSSKGEQRWSARLKEADVLSIRVRFGAGEATAKELAAEYSVVPAHISAIIKRRFWKHLP